MAFSTLDAIRTARLNIELGLDSDSDDRFGTDDHRNYALQEAIRRLWPRMARLTRETVTIVDGQLDYTLSTLREVIKVEQLDEDGLPLVTLTNWRSWWDEEDATPVVRFELAGELSPETSLRLTGYAPYTVPVSNPPSSSGSVDLQPEDEWIIVLGAKALLFERQLNQFMTYERHENENRKTFLSPEQLLAMTTAAKREFEAAIRSRARRMVMPRKAIRTRR